MTLHSVLHQFTPPALQTPAAKREAERQAVHAALSHLQEKAMGPKHFDVVRWQNGRPTLLSPPDWDISWSHTEGAVYVAAGPGWIGVDVERDRPVSADIWDMLGVGDERSRFSNDIIAIWTIKEAVLKLLGLGISGWLGHVTVDSLDSDGNWCCLVSETIVKIVNFQGIDSVSPSIQGRTQCDHDVVLSWTQVARHQCRPLSQRLTPKETEHL